VRVGGAEHPAADGLNNTDVYRSTYVLEVTDPADRP
jgi:hypothetical protein